VWNNSLYWFTSPPPPPLFDRNGVLNARNILYLSNCGFA
jgi:hypothetical protein